MAGTISGIAFIVLFQSGEVFKAEGNTHTNTYNQQKTDSTKK